MEENTVEITYDKNFNRNKCIIIFLALLFIHNFVINATSIQKITYFYVWIHNMIEDPAFVVSSFFLQTFKTILVYLVPFSFDSVIITVTSIIYIILIVRACIQSPGPKFVIVGAVLLIFPSIRKDILFLYPVAFDFVTGGVILVWCLFMRIVYGVFKSKKRRKELYGV